MHLHVDSFGYLFIVRLRSTILAPRANTEVLDTFDTANGLCQFMINLINATIDTGKLFFDAIAYILICNLLPKYYLPENYASFLVC